MAGMVPQACVAKAAKLPKLHLCSLSVAVATVLSLCLNLCFITQGEANGLLEADEEDPAALVAESDGKLGPTGASTMA